MTRPNRRSLAIVALFTLVALASTAPATSAPARYPTASGRLNSTVGTCGGGAATGGDFGTVWVTRLPGNYLAVKIQIRKGEPNETYVVNISCVGAIGSVTTGGDGRGTALLPPFAAPPPPEQRPDPTQLVLDVHLADPCCGDPAQTSILNLPLL